MLQLLKRLKQNLCAASPPPSTPDCRVSPSSKDPGKKRDVSPASVYHCLETLACWCNGCRESPQRVEGPKLCLIVFFSERSIKLACWNTKNIGSWKSCLIMKYFFKKVKDDQMWWICNAGMIKTAVMWWNTSHLSFPHLSVNTVVASVIKALCPPGEVALTGTSRRD